MAKRFRKNLKPTVAYAEARAADPVPVPVPVPVPDLVTAPIPDAIDLTPPPMPIPAAEDLSTLPAPDEIPFGDPTSPAAPPGRVPPGNSRSLRRGDVFALVYLHDSALVERAGTVGLAGTWRVVSYPSRAAAAHAYALECSRLHAEGFVDYAG